MISSPKKRVLFIVALLFFLALGLMLTVYVKNYILGEITQWIEKQYDGFYKLQTGSSSLSFISGEFRVENISVTSDTTSTNTLAPLVLNGSIHSLQIQWESIWDVVFRKKLHITSIEVNQPDFEIQKNLHHEPTPPKPSSFSIEIDRIQLIQPKFKSASQPSSIDCIEYYPSRKLCILHQLNYEISDNNTHPSHLFVNKIAISSFPELKDLNEINLAHCIFDIDSTDIYYHHTPNKNTPKATELWPDSLPTPLYKIGIPTATFRTLNIRIDNPNKQHYIHANEVLLNNKTIETKGLSIKFKNSNAQDWTQISIPNATIKGLNKDSLFQSEKVFLEEFIINGGKFIYIPSASTTKTPENKSKAPLKSTISEDYPGLELPFELTIEKTDLSGMQFIIPKSGNQFWMSLTNIHVNADHVIFQKEKFPVFRNATISIGKSQTSISRAFYRLAIDSAFISFNEQSAYIHNFRIVPTYGKDEFGEKLGYQTDRMYLSIPRIQLSECNWIGFIDEGSLSVQNLDIDGYVLELYRDRRIPFNHDRYVPMPQKILMDAPFPFSIQNINAANGRISYEEYSDKRRKTGKISFHQSRIQAENLQSRPGKTPVTMSFSSSLMNKSKFEIELTMSLSDPSYMHHLEGHIEALDISVLNDFLEVVAGISIQKGFLDRAELSLDADSSDAEIEMTMLYHGLKINVNRNPDQEDEIRTNKFLTGLANMVLLKNNPMPFKPVRTVNAGYERKTDKFVINYWWKTLLAGMIKSFLPDMQLKKEETTRKLKKREQKRQQRLIKIKNRQNQRNSS